MQTESFFQTIQRKTEETINFMMSRDFLVPVIASAMSAVISSLILWGGKSDR